VAVLELVGCLLAIDTGFLVRRGEPARAREEPSSGRRSGRMILGIGTIRYGIFVALSRMAVT
jgi:hypothetical protein